MTYSLGSKDGHPGTSGVCANTPGDVGEMHRAEKPKCKDGREKEVTFYSTAIFQF